MLPEIKIARLVRRKYRLPTPFDIKSFADTFSYVLPRRLPQEIDAFFLSRSTDHKKSIIVLNNTKSDTRQNFTLAHEVGHFLIPWHTGNIFCSTSEDDDSKDIIYKQMESEANRFAAELLMPEEWIRTLATGKQIDIPQVISNIREIGISHTAAYLRLAQYLPAGYVFIEVSNGKVLYSTKSRETTANIPFKNETLNLDSLMVCDCEHGIIPSYNPIHWFYFPEQKPIPSHIDQTSPEIINQIMEDIELSSHEKTGSLQSINGIIGATNSRARHLSAESLYSSLLNRFSSRQQLHPIVSHPRFKDFLAQKARELIARRR